MNFYGKVLDDKGKVIPEAFVLFHHYFFNDKNEPQVGRKKIKADMNGVFAIEDVWGYRLKIVDIFKYEYFRNRVIRGNFDDLFFLSNFSGSFVPNKNNPEVFHLVNELSGDFNCVNQFYYPKIIKSGEEKEFFHEILGEIESRNPDKFDIKVTIKLLKDKCIVSIVCHEENSSFIVSDTENINLSDHNAKHEDNFELQVVEQSKNYQRYEKYLLLKFLNGRFYAKLHLDFLLGDSECQYYAESRTNLFGTKEFDDFKKIKYTGRIYKHLRESNGRQMADGLIDDFLQYRIFEEDEKLINP